MTAYMYWPVGTNATLFLKKKVLRTMLLAVVNTCIYSWTPITRNPAKVLCFVILPLITLKAHANECNKCQQIPILLGVVGQQCCVRLHGPKSLTGFKLYATSANKCQHCCGSMQMDAASHNIVGPNNVGCCWPTMLGPFAWAFSRLWIDFSTNVKVISVWC